MGTVLNFYNPSGRRQSCPLFNWYYLHQTARNLAAAFAAIHKRGDLVADVNSRNILASQRALVTLVDTDSFQVSDPDDGHVFRCPVGTAEYTPPELQNCDLGTVDRKVQHDCFGLAIILFQLLMEGTHPFAGAFLGVGDPPPYEDRIRQGHFPYSEKNNVPYRPMPIAPPLNILFPSLQHLFIRCFEDGHRNPYARPDAQAWQNALEEAADSLIPCTINIQHRYGKHLTSCPWCERTKLLGGRDPFPSVQVVQKGQHLQPLKPKPRHQPHHNGQTHRSIHVAQASQSVGAAGHGRHRHGQQLPNLAQPTLPTHPQPVHGQSNLLSIVVIFSFGLACVFADDWRHSLLFAIVALFAGLGRKIFQKKPYMLAAVNVQYNGFTVLMVAGALAPLIMPPIILIVLFPFVIAVWFLADHRLSFLLKYVVFLLCALMSSVIVGSWQTNNAPVSQTLPLSQAPPNSQASPISQVNPALQTSAEAVNMVNANADEPLRILAEGSSENPTVAWSPDGQTIARTNSDNTVSLWNVGSGTLQQKLNLASTVDALAWSPNGRTLATASLDGAIKFWNSRNGKLLAAASDSGRVAALRWSPNGRMLASVNWNGTITLWHGLATSRTTIETTTEATSFAWSPDGKTLATTEQDGTISLWNTARSKLQVKSDSISATVIALAWSPDGKTIASGGSDQQITLWNVFEKRSISALSKIQGHTAMILALAWSPNGKMLASSADDRTVRVWDPASGTQLHIVTDPKRYVQALAWSPDSRTLAIDNAETISLWNVSY